MSYLSKTYSLPEQIEIFFRDSGPPVGSKNYTTLLIFHGNAFTGGKVLISKTFPPLLHCTRTLFTDADAEADDLTNGRRDFLDRNAVLIAHFLKCFIEEESIPTIDEEREGGVALLGWSMGTPTATSFFAHHDLLSSDDYEFLSKYVKNLIVYDSPAHYLGYQHVPPVKGAYNPFNHPDNKDKSVEEVYDEFALWASSYFDHDLEAGVQGWDFRKYTDRRTISTWTEEEMERIYRPANAMRVDNRLSSQPMVNTLRTMTVEALFDENTVIKCFPEASVAYITCDRSPWNILWGTMELRKEYAEHAERGEKIRPVKFIDVKGENHFLFWDDPQKFLRVLREKAIS
ncbi:hypothetical protein D9758_014920 [Tetrapyrgos nigripes]|uniref:AB hydrolase-1 domain-containing protein n=1 Tax=Tetrapyrgos nigripes TaxID=182062 RepID=A0A8H5FHN7_9AGAR|nr:hypothetical protein D9758_014920 [Tetrapyrgos nigripes]